MEKKKPFSEEVKTKCLLWSDRHCGVCGKSCGLDIEVHHIDPKEDNIQDNAIPVCYNCHAKLGRYIDSQPRGTKYKIQEIKKSRDQIYERYTSHLVPGLLPTIYPTSTEPSTYYLPQIGFAIAPVGQFIPVKATIVVKTFLGGKDLGKIGSKIPYYDGGIIWHLNPGLRFRGNFTIPKVCAESKEALQLELNITIIDPYEREHKLLPVCFTYVRKAEPNDGYWFLEPTSFAQLEQYVKKSNTD
ncbi:MAG: HNH endonuclease [Candidatus Bathyarchaeota archaeon]|nr:HNH endonuclease [Candidatus Bathyarchaeum sp.]